MKPGESALSLEFYDRSAQYLLDEYLMDFIDYETFIEEIDHPPPNHKDYRSVLIWMGPLKAEKLYCTKQLVLNFGAP